MGPESKGLYEFGPFRFDRSDRTLWRDGQMLSLTPKALDTLATLLDTPGRLVEKDDLMKAVWPDSVVEEGNLAVQISLLRKTLGEETYIETVPRRGYRFVAGVRLVEATPALPVAPERPPAPPPLPADHSRRWLIGGGLAAAAATGAALWRFGPWRTAVPVASVAVLPFQVLQAKPGEEGMGLGLADAVITRLGGLNRFVVRPTGAVRQFDRPGRDPLAAGNLLGVDAVLDATVQSAGSRLRLNAQLVSVRDGRHPWTDTIDLDQADLFTLEDQLSGRLLRSLFGQGASAAAYRPNPEAYRLFTLGRYQRNRWSVEGQRRAIEYAEQAIAIDGHFAAAHALKAASWALLGYFFGTPPREAYPKAEEAAQQALSLDDHLADAHHAAAVIRLFYYWDFSGAEQHLRRALELNPSDADSMQVLGLVQTIRHRNAEGLATMKRALAVDPSSAQRHVGLSFQYACSGDLDAAIAEGHRGHEIDPALFAPMFDLYNLYMTRGEHAKAMEWLLKQSDLPGAERAVGEALRRSYAESGIRGVLTARIDRATGRAGSPLVVAQQYTFLGKPDDAMKWVEQAMEERQATVVFINQHPMYSRLRGHPRFREAVRKMGL